MAEKILVTGGAGYIGSHACKALRSAGFTPVTYDNLCTGHAELVRWGPLEEGDILDFTRLGQVISSYRPIAAMHFAARSLVGESTQNPELYYRTNVAGTNTLLSALHAYSVGYFVFSGSCAVYGDAAQMPITEDAPIRPTSVYGRTKAAAENMIEDFGKAYGLAWLSLRYFNACGADPEGETGEKHDPETHLIPRAIQAAFGEVAELELFGTDYPTPDGTCLRDYVHVSDLADAHVRALSFLLSGGRPRALNLGTGKAASVGEIVREVESVTGRRVPIKVGARRVGDPPELVADPTRAVRELQLPAFRDVRQAIEDAVRYHELASEQARV